MGGETMVKLYWFNVEGQYVTVKASSLKKAKVRLGNCIGIPRKYLRIAQEMM
jgi:hypothetical protein